MTTDSQSPFADPADDEEAPNPAPDPLPLEANEADVAEQRTEVPGWDDDEPDGT